MSHKAVDVHLSPGNRMTMRIICTLHTSCRWCVSIQNCLIAGRVALATFNTLLKIVGSKGNAILRDIHSSVTNLTKNLLSYFWPSISSPLLM